MDKIQNQQIEQKFIQFQFRYQVIVKYVPIKTTEAPYCTVSR